MAVVDIFNKAGAELLLLVVTKQSPAGKGSKVCARPENDIGELHKHD